VDTLAALAEAAGLEVHFSVSPDKITIHPEMLHPRSAGLAGCRIENGNRWRRLATAYAPSVIDHAAALLTGKATHRGHLFYATDTHWNRAGSALAVNQLVAVINGTAQSRDTATLAYTSSLLHTDVRNKMLLLSELEPEQTERVSLSVPAQPERKVAFIHDSFYQHAQRALHTVFPNSEFMHMDTAPHDYAAALLHPEKQLVIVNSVERSFFHRFETPFRTHVPEAIITRNMAAAERCDYQPAGEVLSRAVLRNLSRDADGYTAATADPQVVIALPDRGADCIGLTLTLGEPGLFEVFLPPLAGRPSRRSFESGRSFAVKLAGGTHRLRFMLPAHFQEHRLRIDPTDRNTRFSIDTFAFGSMIDIGNERVRRPSGY
jgi:hypothetical protein